MKHATTTTNWWFWIWSSGQSVLGRSCFRPKWFQAGVFPDQRPKCASGWSMLGAKVVFGPNLVLAEVSSKDCLHPHIFRPSAGPAQPVQCNAFPKCNGIIDSTKADAGVPKGEWKCSRSCLHTHTLFHNWKEFALFFCVMNLFYVSYFEVKLVKALFASRIRHTKRSLLLLNAIKIKSFYFKRIFSKENIKERVP